MRRLASLALVLLTVGCGAQGAVDAEEVAAKTGGAASAKLDMWMSADPGDEALSAEEEEELSYLTFSATGAIAEHGRLFRLSYIYPAKTLGLEQAGDVEFDAILDARRGELYVKYGKEIGIDLPPGKSWVHMSARDLQGNEASSDPSQMVAYLYAAGELDREGEERVRGVPTVKYAATIDVAKAYENLGGTPGKDLQKSFESLKKAGVREIPMDVWIDDAGYSRRIDLNWELPDTKGARLKMHMELWDFGKPVDVRLPAASTVVEQQDLDG